MQSVVARHVETSKNLSGIHGRSDSAEITPLGAVQVERLARVAVDAALDRISFVPTRQAEATARAVSELSGIPLAGEISLRPLEMGIAAGLSHDELGKVDIAAATSLKSFRVRRIDATKLSLPSGESAAHLRCRVCGVLAGPFRGRPHTPVQVGQVTHPR